MKDEQEFILTKPLTVFMACICGVAVANLYYLQPLEAQIADSFHISESQTGFAAMLVQLGYAFGLLLFVPLGDMLEQRALVIRMLLLTSLSLLITGFAPSYGILLAALFAVGLTTIVPQLIIPYAAHLSSPKNQGAVIGDIMSGLLIGILLSRAFSGLVGAAAGWRIVYGIAAVLDFILALLVRVFLPESKTSSDMSYTQLLVSIPALIKKQRTVREAAINGFCMFGAFSVFWATLVFFLETPHFNMGTREAGLFGFAGVAGALAAPLIGKVADKKSPRFSVGIGVVLALSAYGAFLKFGFHLWGLIVGVVVLDLGNQCGQVSNMARVQHLGDTVRNRNNMVFMFSYFVGGAAGSLLGTICFRYAGWYGVCAAGFCFLLAAAVFHFIVYRRKA